MIASLIFRTTGQQVLRDVTINDRLSLVIQSRRFLNFRGVISEKKKKNRITQAIKIWRLVIFFYFEANRLSKFFSSTSLAILKRLFGFFDVATFADFGKNTLNATRHMKSWNKFFFSIKTTIEPYKNDWNVFGRTAKENRW